MANRGYDVVVDVDEEVILFLMIYLLQLTGEKGDLGHTDLREDLEFHSSSNRFTPHNTTQT